MKRFSIIIFVFYISINAYTQDSITLSNSIKVTLFPFLKPLTNSHAKVMGIEYERKIKSHLSIIERVEFGNFLNYTFYRYYNHLKDDPQDYIKTMIYVNGYHSVTSLRYYIVNDKAFYFYSGLLLDMHQYFIKSEIESTFQPNDNLESKSKLFQISPGIELGGRYTFMKKITADINVSVYKDIYYNAPMNTYIPPQNGFWISDDLMKWAVVNIQIGYNF